jgi:hypothetical protein
MMNLITERYSDASRCIMADLGKPVAARATIGWWVAGRIAREGQMVVYEGTSMESMWDSTADLGTRYIRVLAPGVYSTTPPGRQPPARSIMQREIARRHPAPPPRRIAPQGPGQASAMATAAASRSTRRTGSAQR